MSGDRAERAEAVLEIDLAGIVANWRLLARRVEPARCAGVVKADAYGLGAPRVSAALAAAGCRLFFVATLDEGMALRGALPACCEIAVLNGPAPGSAEEFVSHCLIPVLNEPGQIATWAAAARRHSCLPAVLQVDTGMLWTASALPTATDRRQAHGNYPSLSTSPRPIRPHLAIYPQNAGDHCFLQPPPPPLRSSMVLVRLRVTCVVHVSYML